MRLSHLIPLALVVFVSACSKESDSEGKDKVNNQPISKYWLNPDLDYGKVKDANGYEYATIKIGHSEWMAENLRSIKYCNGDDIHHGNDPEEWFFLNKGAYTYYDRDLVNEKIYGKMYNWHAVNDERNICPCGWRVASIQDWDEMIDYLGGDSIAGGKLKSQGTNYWKAPNLDATNESGFSAVGGGILHGYSTFEHLNETVFYWTADAPHDVIADIKIMWYDSPLIRDMINNKNFGNYVRCIKD